MRQNYRMSYDLLLSRIKERLEALGLSERKACLQADVGINTIRHIRVRGHAPKPAALAKLAAALGVPASYFLDVAGGQPDAAPRAQSIAAVSTVYVKGAVQAGVWQEALEWSPAEWQPVYVPEDERYRDVDKFGLLVRGTSMNKVYPEGSIIIAVRLDDLGRMPRSGERVVVLKRMDKDSGMEATIKRYEVDAEGRNILWPESYDPLYQTPIILDDIANNISNDGRDADHACCQDLNVCAIVIGSYRPE